LNKIDLVPPKERPYFWGGREAILVSSLQHTGLEQLLTAIDAALIADPLVEANFRIPQSEGAILASLEGGAIISEKRFEGNLVSLQARGPSSLLGRHRRLI
jgi:GTPase